MSRDAAIWAAFVRHVFGCVPPAEKSPEEQRWEDDGGPLSPWHEQWDHVIQQATPTYVTMA